MDKFIEKLSMENLQSFFKLFNGDKCENCQCVSPKDAAYLKNLLQIKSNENIRIISCFFIKKEYRGTGIQKELLGKVIDQCKREGVKSIYSIPVFDDFLNKVNEELKLEKLHTGYKKLFDEFEFKCIGNNGRYYFMNKKIDFNNK